ncbi:DMP19 family protein [Flavihumibacter petaseus]|uniref:DNA mimic protein DMP19 C-terminal domain-containing protein n=1 Tax=Flavihumibacter petaseus NBRC 106054 TaxID=1220578 RepID=A0A0E9N6C4_9BACT|nr:DUF4375 domain-containing protein [Flavihumibacter petaseus]GAO45359.1 hypothetical protein FPE01S_05_00560 [Flavihumibacter petaseus NBRC 106054]
MITLLLNLLGCSGKTKQREKSAETDTLNNHIIQSVEAFENRPIHRVLTVQIIDSTSDDELLQTVIDNLTEKLPIDYSKEYQVVSGWSKPQQAIYITWWLEAEINNGGFNQYYANPAGQFAALAPPALNLIGASGLSSLVARANQLYTNEKEKITRHQDGTLEGFSKSYDDNPLEKFDDEFYDLNTKEALQKIQVAFIRNHKQDFIDK